MLILKAIDDDILKKKTIDDNDPLWDEQGKIQKSIGKIRDEMKTIDSKISWLEIK